MPSPCNPEVVATGVNQREAEELLLRVKNLAQIRAERASIPIDQALKEIAGEIQAEEKTIGKVFQRNALLAIKAKQTIKNHVGRFLISGRTAGEGVLSFLQGSARVIGSARLSVDYQSKALHGKYFGRLVSELEKAGVLRDFKKANEALTLDIYREMGAIQPGMPTKSITGNKTAYTIATILDGVNADIVTRMNLAGAFIKRMPGYIAHQTHDMSAIRALGGIGNSQLSKQKSYEAWKSFVMPLIDNERTFQGADPEKTLRHIHEALYTGVHGAETFEANVQGNTVVGSLSAKVSRRRVLHFSDADAAFKYNQKFGIRDFKEQILQDLHHKARIIALTENLGPTPEVTLQQVIRELQEEARLSDDAAKQVDSLNDWRIMAAYNEISGKNEMSLNPTLTQWTGFAKVMAQLSKMGGVVLSSFTDRAFLQAEMTHQGMGHLQTFVGQLQNLIPKTTNEKQTLRLMGVAMDGLMGGALSRYTNHSSKFGWAHDLQKHFFNLNGLNLWTDASKGAAAHLMAAHLGEHANLKFSELPEEISRLLSLYEITPTRWESIRQHVVNQDGAKMLLPSEVKIPDTELVKLVEERGLTANSVNIERERNLIDTALRTYYIDRVDHAIPTPGAAERKYSTFDTKAGTPLGEAVRMIMLFKSFPITIMRKILGREIYGRGSQSLGQWLMHDHRGKFNMATMIAMGTAAGYVSGSIRDMLKGRTPKPLIDEDGNIAWKNVNDAAIRGGSLGILGDVIMSEYESNYRGFLQSMAGPIAGQIETVMDIKTGLQRGENVGKATGKLLLDNTPLINLFYIRPVLDYLVLWNLQEMMSPGTLRRMESEVERNNHQGFFMKPSQVTGN
ncbi:structural protein [Caudoviricetes sp.]|nr:structural protein [Caudoviricetes sp.]